MKSEILELKDWVYGKAGAGEYESAQVPGDVAADYFRNRGISDYDVGLNYKQYEGIVHGSYEYLSEFDGNAFRKFDRVYLRCNGIDTFAEVWLNGVKLGETDNMFRAYVWEIKQHLQAGTNQLKILLKPYYETRKNNDGVFSIFETDRIYTRKAQFHTGWDWSPFGVPAYGIYRSVEVWGESGTAINDVYVRTKNNGEGVMFVELSQRVFGKKLILETAGRRFEAECVGKKNIVCFHIEDPKLWFPNGYGAQDRYEYTLTLEGEDSRKGMFAFREVELDESSIGANRLDFRIVVNGIPIFCKGSNWVPCERLTGTASAEKYRKLLQAAADANFNMLRVWGGGIYENDIFYDTCDRLGIMIFQEVMFACSDIPADAEFQKSVVEELEYQLPRLRNHPCIVLWSGGNEMFNSFHCHIPMQGKRFAEYLSRGLIASMTDVPYITASPFGRTDILNDLYSGDGHNNALENCIIKQNAELLRDEIMEPKARFTSECCMFGPGVYKSLLRYIPEDKLWPLNEVYSDRYMCNPYSDSPLDFAHREKFMADGLFGACDSASDFVKKGMAAQAEILRAECDYMRAGHGTGFLTWMFDDCWPTGTWSVIDYYLQPKASYFALKRAFRSVLPIITQEKKGTCSIYIANDASGEKQVAVEYGIRRLNGEKIFCKTVIKKVAPYHSEFIDTLVLPQAKDEYCYACLPDDAEASATYFGNYWKDIEWKSDYFWDVVKQGNGYEVRICSRAYTRMCHIEIPSFPDAVFSDNYFDIEAGNNKSVFIKTDKELSAKEICVKDWNSDWK